MKTEISSIYIEKEKLKFAIEQFKEVIENNGGTFLINKYRDLEQSLKNLENNKMTTEEFNEKYKNYIEDGHYGLDIYNQNVIEYLDNQFQELIKIPNFSYSQIKTKFNSVRFYCENVDLNKIREIETEIETLLWKK
jgi:uncharacterized membrane protein